MKAADWRKRIKKNCQGIGTYQPAFDSVIADLANILEQRDTALDQFIADGSVQLVKSTSDRGAVNMKTNPLLVLWDKLNNTALGYWRDLGLTPKGLKTINESAVKSGGKKPSALVEALKQLG